MTVLGVHAASSEASARAFVAKRESSHTILLDETGVMMDYGVTGIPHTVLIDGNGHIRATHVGFGRGDPAKFEAEVNALLAE